MNNIKMTPLRHKPDAELSKLLTRMYDERGVDFRNYKPGSLKRRVSKRFHALNISSYNEYFAMLDSDPAEYNRLLSYITIKVSEFFREPEVFDELGFAIKSSLPVDDGLRVWCCACANGEEPYSLAMLCSETLGPQALRQMKIFATDIDSDALDAARKGEYKEDFLVNVSPQMLDKHFVKAGPYYRIKSALSNLVKFGRHNIVTDRPLTKMHILFCRNLFIYFNKELQEEAFKKLDYALATGGLLVMGKSESIPKAFAHRYAQINRGLSIYRKIDKI